MSSICPALLILLFSGINVSLQQQPDADLSTTPSTNEVSNAAGSASTDKSYIEELHYDPYHSLILWHGIFMLFACLVLIPGGIFVVRYFKEAWSTLVFFGIPLWLMVHFAYMLASVMFLFLGLVFANAHSSAANSTDEIKEDDDESEVKTLDFHTIAGWLSFGLLIMQFASGHFLPFSNDSLRPIFRMVHWACGNIALYSLIIIAMVSVSLEGSQLPYFSAVVIMFWLIFLIVMNGAAAMTMHRADKELLMEDLEGKLVFYRAFWPLPIPLIHFDEEPNDTHLRTIIFVWFQFGCLAAFVIIIIPYALGLGHYDCSEYSFINFDCETPRPHTIY